MSKLQGRREPQPRVIAIGGSADVVITQHVRRGRTTLLPRLLARRCKLMVKEAAPYEELRPSDDDGVCRPAPHEAVR